MTNRTYHYMIGFVGNGATSFGQIEVTLPYPLTTMDRVREVQQLVRNHSGMYDASILAFSLFGDPSGES
ncbi:hypothetical protein Val02_93520 [Virgisporangium aliadipatigenens]|uniref:Uncharacterized protein n=1 Tax=Virgisporangium aliadipatigenens TaxID=741659 RepID=A0A8J4DWF6_9ACTN|nr:hypothetical protein [Virgisporangium aliadipatigenens]GIJ52466.1 hypothetical protein Val02_93520 [Virgisporangium aliadipatigenens]